MAGIQRAGAWRMRLEQLEARDVPAIVQTGLPTWLSAGPAPQINAQVTVVGNPPNTVTGAVEELAPHPTDPNILFVAGINGGIWRTFNAQDPTPTFTPLTDNLPSLSISSMSLNPENPNQLVAGVGLLSAAGRVGGDLVGLLVTDNALSANPTFRVVGGPLVGENVYAVSERNGYIIAGGDRGIFRSTDGGATFTELTGTGGLPAQGAGPGGQSTYYFLQSDPADSNRVYVVGDTGVFRTENARAAVPTWTNVTSPLMKIDGNVVNAKIAIHNSALGNVVYVATNDDQARSVTFSTDHGATWQAMDLPTRSSGPRVITNATNTAPIVITSPFHRLNSGDVVVVSGVVGNTAANAIYTVTVIDQNTFSLDGSVGTGNYVSGGQFSVIQGPNEGGQGSLHFSLAADPNDPNIIYIGGDTTENVTGNLFRGNRAIAPAGGNILPSPQYTSLVDNNSSGTAPHPDSRILVVDAAGVLLEGDDGGFYRRTNPRFDGSPWEASNGNLDLGQFYSISYDSNNNVLFGGTQDTGSFAQVDGTGPAGNRTWTDILLGDGGTSDSDNTSKAGFTYRYLSGNVTSTFTRVLADATNTEISRNQVLFAAPGTKVALSGLLPQDRGFTVFDSKFVLNAVDPRLAILGNTGLYEDDNPVGLAADNVANVTPPGLAGKVTAIVYGGRVSGTPISRVAYVGSQAGQLFFRGGFGGFTQLTNLPGFGEIDSVVVDPDNFQNVYVLRGADFGTNAIYFSADAGQTWTNITQNLITSMLNADGTPVLYQVDPVTGAVTGGLSTQIRDLAIYDPNPGDSGGGTTLLAAGRGGVYRFSAGLNPFDSAATPFGWTQYGLGLPNALSYVLKVSGNRLIVGTQGRGAWVIPDVSGTISQAATVTVVGGTGDDTLTLTGDPRSPNSVVVSDGMGNFLSLGRSNSPTLRFLGGEGADTIQILGSADTGDLSVIKIPIFIDGGTSPGDRLVVANGGRATATTATVAANSIGAASGDNLFGKFPGAGLTYVGFSLGSVELDLGNSKVGGNSINLQSTGAAKTRLVGTRGQDTILLNSFAGLSAAELSGAVIGGARSELAFLNGLVEIDGRSGGDSLIISDAGAVSGNANVTVSGNLITGLTGGGDTGNVTFANVGSLTLLGSNSAGVAESFTLNNPAAPLTLNTYDGPDAINVRALTNALTVEAGDGDDVIRVGSLAGASENGTLDGINAPLFINAGAGANRLLVSDFGSASGRTYNVTSNTIFGATPNPISFIASGGSFSGPGGSGVVLRGGQGADSFSVTNTDAASQFVIQGNGGDDVFSIDSLTTLGLIRLEGGAGADTLAFDPGTAANKAAGVTFDGGGGGDGLRFLGRDDADDEAASVTLTGANSGFFSGRGAAFPFANVAFADFDGRSGKNSFTLVDGSGLSRSVVFTPGSLTAGRFDLDAAFRVGVTNINGGLTYVGTSGSGGPDDLTYQGFSDLNSGANPTRQGGDDLFVTDAQITNFNDGLGEVIPLNIGRDNGAATLSTMRVLGGDEVGGGDRIGVRASDDIPIALDGQGPTRVPGDKLTILPGGGAPLSAVNFENRPNARSIYAVGADAGGGPRVRVYDSNTNQVLFDDYVYDVNFTGGVRVAVGDVTGDGVPDLVTAAGFGGGPHIRVFDGVTFQVVSEFFAYEDNFRGGAFVAVGDLAGTGINQIITGPGNGGGPLVKIFNGDGSTVRAFFAYDPIFRGGVRVAAGDVNGDGFANIITGAGVGGGPHVRVFNAGDASVLTEYLAYDPNYRGGVYVAAGDVDGDGFADIITGPGDNTIPNLTFRSSLDGGAVTMVNPFASIDNAPPIPVPPQVAAFNVELGGIRVAVTSSTDGVTNRIVATRGPGFPPRLVNYFATQGGAGATDGGLAFEDSFIGGLYVG